MKVAIAQIGTDPGAFEANKLKIKAYIEKAKLAGAELVVFPEGAVQGYAHLDLVFDIGFVEASKTALKELAKSCKGVTAILGFVDSEEGVTGPGGKPVLYNCAAILADGEVKTIRDKTLLPEYDIFSEQRYFSPGKRTGLFQIAGLNCGVGICEDLWASGYDTKIYPNLLDKGAELLINISASPFHVNKDLERFGLVNEILKNRPAAFIYANLMGSYDGYDGEVVFDGRSMIWNKQGQLCAVANSCKEQLLIADIEKDPEIKMPSTPEVQQLYDALILGVREYFRRCGFERAYIGLSGGIDSAVVAALVVAALGENKVIGVTMPSDITSSETLDDAIQLAKNLNIRIDTRPIKAEYTAWQDTFNKHIGTEAGSLTKQNKQARIRGSILMEYSNQDTKGIVVSTGNKTELALGYCTLYGDMCGGFAAISDVSKERVYLLADYINTLNKKEIIPNTTIKRAPTAELELGQTDAANLPADYDVISPLVDMLVDQQLTKEQLYLTYPKRVVDSTARLIKISEFKRRQAAPGIRVTKKAFGIGRRIPIVHGYEG